jgi:hypothetical protein
MMIPWEIDAWSLKVGPVGDFLKRGRGDALRRRPVPVFRVVVPEAYAFRTLAACRPLGPWTMSYSRRSPSASVLKPSPEIAE